MSDLPPSSALAALQDYVTRLSRPAAVMDDEGRVLAANPAFLAVVGVAEYLPGLTPMASFFRRSTGRETWDSEFNPGLRRCYQLRRSEGSVSRIEVSISVLDLTTDFPALTTPCRLMQIEGEAPEPEVSGSGLEVSELGYALAIQGGADGMWEWNPLTKDLYLSPRLLAILGYPESFAVRTTDDWLDLVHPDDRQRYNRENSRHLRRETAYFQCEYRIRRADGEWAWGYSRGLASFDEHGVARRMAGSITDITARKQAESALEQAHREVEALNATLEQRVADRTRELAAALDELRRTHSTLDHAHEQLVRAETLVSLGRMVAVIAHELNTPIGNSRIAASTLREEAAAFARKVEHGLRRSELDDFLNTIDTGTHLLDAGLQRAASLVSSFKQVAVDQTSAQRRAFDLQELINEIRITLDPSLRRSGCRQEWQVEQSLPMNSYPGPLGQILINLIDNSVIHGFDGRSPGTIRVSAAGHGEDWVLIEVRDDGVGVPAAYQSKIFDPFFTTRMGRGGTGLGLSIVYNIATGVLGGQVSVSSNYGEGARFQILLPRVAPQRQLAS